MSGNTTTLKNVLLVIQHTINSVDGRLVNHGEQVGFICYRMGLAMGYTEEQLLPLCSVAMMHDIGAYKVDERKRMVEFEVEQPHEHAVYGSLFLRHFGPFANASNVILYHHWRYHDRRRMIDERLIPPESFLIHLADRVSVLFAHTGSQLESAVKRQIPQMACRVFDPEHVALLLELVDRTDIIDSLLDGSYLDEFYDFLDNRTLSSHETILYLSTLVYAIEFRSRQTVTHSISVATSAAMIAKLAGLPEEDIDLLRHAALLHDVGKITTPIDILTKPGGLSQSELDVMRGHVSNTLEILTGTGLGRIMEIASNHHERPNGKGYPRGLKGEELCLPSRVLAVADMFTALVEPRYYKPALPREDVLAILRRSAESGDIDPCVFAIVQDNFDSIKCETDTAQRTMLALYDEITQEYERLLENAYSTLDASTSGRIGLLKAA